MVKEMITAAEIAAKVHELAGKISGDYENKAITLVGTLKGALHFMSDLARNIPLDVELEFIKASSYGDGTESSGKIVMEYPPLADLTGKHVIIVEDIIDTGHTAKFLREHFMELNLASLAICALLDKPGRREVEVTIEYIGFAIPDAFVVGYGLDFAQKYRHLPYIGILQT